MKSKKFFFLSLNCFAEVQNVSEGYVITSLLQRVTKIGQVILFLFFFCNRIFIIVFPGNVCLVHFGYIQWYYLQFTNYNKHQIIRKEGKMRWPKQKDAAFLINHQGLTEAKFCLGKEDMDAPEYYLEEHIPFLERSRLCDRQKP